MQSGVIIKGLVELFKFLVKVDRETFVHTGGVEGAVGPEH